MEIWCHKILWEKVPPHSASHLHNDIKKMTGNMIMCKEVMRVSNIQAKNEFMLVI